MRNANFLPESSRLRPGRSAFAPGGFVDIDVMIGAAFFLQCVDLQIKVLLGRTDTCIADDLSHVVTSRPSDHEAVRNGQLFCKSFLLLCFLFRICSVNIFLFNF